MIPMDTLSPNCGKSLFQWRFSQQTMSMEVLPNAATAILNKFVCVCVCVGAGGRMWGVVGEA